MLRVLTALLFCAAAEAATLNVNLTVNATATPSTSGTSYAVSGAATLTEGISDTGTFSTTLSLTTSNSSSPYTLTLKNGTLAGAITVPLSALTTIIEGATSASGISATVTSATGSYAGDSGTFPAISGSGGFGASGITLTFSGAGTITTGGTVTAPPPTITAVLDAASNTPSLAQGTIFIVQGTYLCPGTTLTEFSVPRPTSAPDGVQITFTPATGGTGTNALLWYEDPGYKGTGSCQLAGILPSTLAVGSYNVTVTNGTVSAPVQANVVKSKFALFTQDSTGGGLAVAQNVVSATQYNLNRLTTGTLNGIQISPAYPGQYMVAYGTGLGGVAGDDNAASPVYDFTKNGVTVQAVIGGTTIPVLFAGRAGYAGEDQINFQLPSNIPTGCTVSFQISVNGTLSPPTTLSIAPNASAGACVFPGLTTTQLTSLDNGGTITSGGFSLSQFTENSSQLGTFSSASADGGFVQVSGFQLASLSGQVSYSESQNTIGSCTVTQVTISGTGQVSAVGGTVTYLDAGTVTLSGPAASNLNNTPMTDTNGSYSLSIGITGITLPGSPNGTLAGGTYKLAAAGGTGVGAFNASINLGSPLTINGGLPSTVVRSQGLPIAWTGGNSSDVVSIIGYSGTSTGTGASAVSTVTEFVCTTTAGTGGFTVSPQVLGQLIATPASLTNGIGFLEVASGPPPVSFNAPLVPSGTVAAFLSASVGTAGLVTYQ